MEEAGLATGWLGCGALAGFVRSCGPLNSRCSVVLACIYRCCRAPLMRVESYESS